MCILDALDEKASSFVVTLFFSNLIDPSRKEKGVLVQKKGNILSHSHSLFSLSLFSSRADDDDAMACASCAEGKMKREKG